MFCLCRSVRWSVALSVHLSVDQMVSAHHHSAFIFYMLIGLGEDKTPIDFVFTRSKVKVTMVTFARSQGHLKKVNKC